MYHIYKNGYSTLPNLKKIKFSEVFEKSSEESSFIQEEKKKYLKTQNILHEHKNQKKFYDIAYDFIIKNYPKKIKASNYLEAAKEIDEDLIIHRLEGEEDYMCSAHVVFPSGWDPANKIGRSFEEIHLPVPMDLKSSKKIVNAIMKGVYERFVWSVVYEEKYNFHPNNIKKEFDINDPKIIVKVERQVSVGFPKDNFCLFILRQYLIKEDLIDKFALAKAIENMSLEQLNYKKIKNKKEIVNYLKK